MGLGLLADIIALTLLLMPGTIVSAMPGMIIAFVVGRRFPTANSNYVFLGALAYAIWMGEKIALVGELPALVISVFIMLVFLYTSAAYLLGVRKSGNGPTRRGPRRPT